MKCPKCGMKLPSDSPSCQYCGIDIVDYLVSGNAPIIGRTPDNAKTEEETNSKTKLQESKYRDDMEELAPELGPKPPKCKKCGGEINLATRRCKSCGKQWFSLKKTLPIIILIIFLAGFGALNVLQFVNSQELKADNDDMSETISTQKSTIARQETTISRFETKAAAYDDMIDALSDGNLGYAASNFNVSESVVVVRKNQTDRKVTLTAYWYDGGLVSLSYSPSFSRSATVSFDEETWDSTTKLSIIPNHEGVTTVTFSNDQDSKTFEMVIIVTD